MSIPMFRADFLLFASKIVEHSRYLPLTLDQRILWWIITVVGISMATFLFILQGVRRGTYTDHHVSRREQRAVPLLFGISCVITVFLLLLLAHDQSDDRDPCCSYPCSCSSNIGDTLLENQLPSGRHCWCSDHAVLPFRPIVFVAFPSGTPGRMGTLGSARTYPSSSSGWNGSCRRNTSGSLRSLWRHSVKPFLASYGSINASSLREAKCLI